VPHAEPTAPHPDLAPVSFLLGRWAGEGAGEYPTTSPFRYGEEMTFTHVGKPFLAYAQRSWNLDDGRPLHAETGYWRCPSAVNLEVVIAHPTGHVEVTEGTIEATSVALSSTIIARARSSKVVETIVRRIDVKGDLLSYELEMAAVEHPLTVHLRGLLRRVARPQ